MNKLSCVRCGQRYYGAWSADLACDLCHAPLEETGWASHGKRAAMVPLPAVRPRLPAYLESGGSDGRTLGAAR